MRYTIARTPSTPQTPPTSPLSNFAPRSRNHPIFAGFLCYNSFMRRSLILATFALGVLWTAGETSAQAQQPRPGGFRPSGHSGTPPIAQNRGHHNRGGGVPTTVTLNGGFGGRDNFRGGRGHFGGRCLGQGCGVYGGGAYYDSYGYYPYYGVSVYTGSAVVDPGPNFYAPNSGYTIEYGSARVPREYVGPGADAVSAAYRQGQLEQRITSLADEVARLRTEKEARERPAANQSDPRNRDPRSLGESFASTGVLDANTPAAGATAAATATLVFRNGQRLDIANYAVVGQTLWVFDEQRARRVPLAELNLDATRKANLASGFELKLPAQK